MQPYTHPGRRIIEIENGKAISYNGNYSAFLVEREERTERAVNLLARVPVQDADAGRPAGNAAPPQATAEADLPPDHPKVPMQLPAEVKTVREYVAWAREAMVPA